mmetsp:Transcript_97993/g.179533  ORF Transcript_97993/g.179533 Transcript_97993/m.179533 type:complete len:97 (-) Transcript_97993:430-720(-)
MIAVATPRRNSAFEFCGSVAILAQESSHRAKTACFQRWQAQVANFVYSVSHAGIFMQEPQSRTAARQATSARTSSRRRQALASYSGAAGSNAAAGC